MRKVGGKTGIVPDYLLSFLYKTKMNISAKGN